MSKLTNLRFNGEFRSYQSKILDHSTQYLKDGKVHIVAAPGSGKTTLGIELICRLNTPALVLAPTVTIRQQWGERIVDSFLPSDEDAADYVSYNLHKPSLITSITYQALYAAYNKLSLEEENEEDNLEHKDLVDFSNFDLLNVIKNSNIKTICLDEAHHLKNEWQKALGAFIAALGKEVTVISLTATPPYDSAPSEWKKYMDLCGEIDEEIYVPQLVAQKTLCPHQDYIYFNYPTDEEAQVLNHYKEKAITCVNDILQSKLFDDILLQSGLLTEFRKKEESILEHVKEFIALLSLAKERGTKVPKKLIKLVSPSGKLPRFSLAYAEIAFQFIMDTPTIFSDEVSLRLRSILSENSLLDKKQVHLRANERINKLLLSSTGKLASINEIVRSEANNLKNELRMLILTDYIKKDLTKIIGSDEKITTMGTVPIFESVRRSCGEEVHLAILSGQLVIIPKDILQEIAKIAENRNVTYTYKDITNTTYIEINFSGSSKNKVAIMTEAFGQGLIQVLVGTKSLLGEGWDSPCINSLILASFVGSFVLSNQMRGRAIRMDANVPDKVSNIWHLVTLEPPLLGENMLKQWLLKPVLEDENTLTSDDFETLKRRFRCFLGPAYTKDIIENGIERIDILKPPYNENGIKEINKKMLQFAADRDTVASRWNVTLGGMDYTEILEIDEIPRTVQPRGFLFQNILSSMFYGFAITAFARSGFISVFRDANSLFGVILGLLVFVGLGYLFVGGMLRIIRYFSPKKTIETLSKCIFNTLTEIKEIESTNARVEIRSNSLGTFIYSCLTNATMHEKYVFAEAMRELLSSINNPRYLLIKSYGLANHPILKYSHSYACPSVIAARKESVEILARYLDAYTGRFSLFYTRNEIGRKVLLKCRKRSYINRNEAIIDKKKVINKWE